MNRATALRHRGLVAAALVALSASSAGGQVIEEWVRITALSTAEPGSAYDGFADLFVDAAGNAYLTGATRNTQRRLWLDIFTVKYAPDGTLLWSAIYDGPTSAHDRGVAVRADGAGNVYVAGTSQGDLVTLKYAPDGTLLWLDRQPRASAEASDARRLELSPDGAIYVMGGWWSDISYPVDAYLTIRLDPDGTRAWTRFSDNGLPVPYKRDEPASMAVDAAGNVYVTGTSSAGPPDYDVVRTVRYDPAGHLDWNVSHAGAPGYETARAAALSPDGAALQVAGQNALDGARAYLVRLDARRGVEEWVTSHDPGYSEEVASLAVDGVGNAVVVGSATIDSSTDWIGVSVAPEGAVRWSMRFNGEARASYDRPARVVRDEQGSWYVAGSSGPGVLPYDYDFVTIKYAASGSELWRAVYAGLNGGASRVALDGQGHVYVAGMEAAFGTTGLPAHTVLIKYAQLGPTSVPAGPSAGHLRLEPPWPNPFRGAATLRYARPEAGRVRLAVFDLGGRRLASLVDEFRPAGSYAAVWDGRDHTGRELPPGLYWAKLEWDREVRTARLVRVR